MSYELRIERQFDATPEVVFDNKRFSENCWTHSAPDLVKLAGLEETRVADIFANPVFEKNWLVVKDWNEKARYENTSHHKAKRLYAAITDNLNGVMPWIRARW